MSRAAVRRLRARAARAPRISRAAAEADDTGILCDTDSGSGDELDEHAWSGLRVAFQGVPGAYSEQAAETAYGKNCVTTPCTQFEDAFQAVEQWSADRAVLPVENSLGGSIHRNYDLMLRHRLHIVGEVNFNVSHCLLALPGVKLEDITRVISHPQALAQCEGSISKLPGQPRKEEWDDTAGAARAIVENGWKDTAAIASSRAADIYGMDTLATAIQDEKNNVTRFIALSREPNAQKHSSKLPYKTSVVFSLEEGEGMLFRALACFAMREIDLTKIESRPMRSKPVSRVDPNSASSDNEEQLRFSYLFYVDIACSMAETRMQNALRNLGEMAPYLRVLGSYPIDARSH